MNLPIYFAIPGDINRLTGGYGYDRRLMSELSKLGFTLQHLQLANSFPEPDSQALYDTEAQLARLPEGALVLIDGLAFGAMATIAERHCQRLKIIALCHHPLALETGLAAERVPALHREEQHALAFAAAVIVTSRNTARILEQTYAVPTSKITVALPGTDKQQFAPCIGAPPILLSVATLTPRKAHDTLIDALAQIAHLPWQARFVGGDDFDTEWATYLRNKVAALSLVTRIEFVGNLADLGGEYSQADVFVLPSLFEGYGMAFAEALSFGLPVVAARAGILVPPANAAGLADALTQLLTDPTRRQRLQLGAQQAAHSLPTWADTAAIVGHLIQQVR